MEAQKPSYLTEFKTNFSAGLVVFLVALPLCLGIALASGTPPLSGIVAGIIGGIVIGFLSTSHISVSGPAAGLVSVILAAMAQLGSFDLFLCAVIIAGAIQLILGFLRAGSIAEYMPTAVIEGMLAGIGILIMLKQLPYAFGGNSGDNWQTLLTQPHLGASFITIISLFIILFWKNIAGVFKNIPAALIAVIVSTIISIIFQKMGNHWTLDAHQLVSLPNPRGIEDIKNMITLPNIAGFKNSYVWITGATMAIVASIETLLSIEAADHLDKQRRITDTNHELRAQGIGNIIAGLLGGLPVTSVIVRSSANADAGATRKTATIVHGFLLLVCVLTMAPLLNRIPLASLAAVLILVGYKLARPSVIKHFWQKGWYQFVPFFSTMIAVVQFDLLKGVGIGLIISIIFILQNHMKRAYYLSREQLADAKVIELSLAEEVSFLNKAAIKKTLKNIRRNSTLIINASNSLYISSDVMDLIEDFSNITAKEKNIRVILRGFKTNHDYENEPLNHHVHIHHHSVI